MDRLVKHWIPALISILVCLLVLLGYAFPSVLSFPYQGQQTGLHAILTEWAVIVAAFAFLLGMVNVLRTHVKKARRPQQGGVYSLIFLLAAAGALAIALLYGPSGEMTQQMLAYVIGPLGASLAALVVFTLTLAAFRLLRTRRSERAKSVVFILVVALVLLSTTPFMGAEGILSSIRDWVVNVIGMAGMRGLLLGVALGTAITALRVLWPRSES
jgi:hypothetical protein